MSSTLPVSGISRRMLLAGFAASSLIATTRTSLAAETLPKMVVTKDPNCGCCTGWVKHVRAAGFDVDVVESSEINQLKTRLGVPQDLASCHQASAGGEAQRQGLGRSRHARWIPRHGGRGNGPGHIRGGPLRPFRAADLCPLQRRPRSLTGREHSVTRAVGPA